MTQAADTDKKWLVKSSGAILGPFALEEVIQQLTQKQISLIDEIRAPDSRWMFIREHKQFANIVQFLRDQQSETREDTNATFINRTITLNPEEVTTVPAQSTPASSAPTPAPAASGPSTPIESRPITYAAQNDKRVQRRVEPERKWLSALIWLATLVTVAAVGAYFFILQKEAPKALGYLDYIKLAKRQQDMGHFEQALGFFRKAESVQKLSPLHRLQMIPLLMVVEKQNVQARQILDEVQQEISLSAKQTMEAANMRAFSYLNEGQLSEAKQRYSELVKENSGLESAHVNLLEISILEGRFQEALDSIRTVMKAGVKEPLVFLYRSLAAYRQYAQNDKLESVIEDLKRYVGRYHDYQPESYLLIAAIQKKLGKEQDMQQTIKSMLQTDPDLSRRHIHELLIHREVFEWDYLGNICDLLLKDSSDTALLKGLAAYCSYQLGDLKAAIEQIEKARAQFSTDGTLLGLHSFLLIKSNRLQEAKALIQSVGGNGNELMVSAYATVCQEQKDWTCAAREWHRIQSLNSQSLAAFAGLARAAVAAGDFERAKDLIQQGLVISALYKPLLEVKDQVDGL
jgi:tetratricopeptide (TPR) repeat protein